MGLDADFRANFKKQIHSYIPDLVMPKRWGKLRARQCVFDRDGSPTNTIGRQMLPVGDANHIGEQGHHANIQ